MPSEQQTSSVEDRWRLYLPAFVFLVHVAAAFTPWLDLGVTIVIGCANGFACRQALVMRRRGSRSLLGFLVGYFILFMVFVPMAKSPILFGTFALMYAACFPTPLLLGYLVILLASVVFITPYWIQSTLLLSLFYSIAAPIFPQRSKRFHLLCLSIGFLLIVSIMLPPLYLCFQVTPQTLLVNVSDPAFRKALWTSLLTATISTGIVFVLGVPLAYAMARLDFRGKRFVESLIDLPIVIPQSVAGIALLVLLGPKTPIGDFLERSLGVEVSGSMLGIIVCQVFVSSPFLVRSAAGAFRDMGPSLENVSRTLGAGPVSTFFRVSLPLASGGIFTGCILTWARAISEAGSLMVLAYHPFTISIYTYDQFIQYGLHESRPAAVLLVIVCLWGFLVLRWLRTVALGSPFGPERRAGR
ncbi:MAG: ABC transporter permease [Lentisphaeria bacterium]|nr:ABC transporter permease [Lentisphaeria bacterium]